MNKLIFFLLLSCPMFGQEYVGTDLNSLSYSFHTNNLYLASVDTFDIEVERFFIKDGNNLKVCPLDFTACDNYDVEFTGAIDDNGGLIYEIKENPNYNWTLNPAKGIAILHSRNKQLIYY